MCMLVSGPAFELPLTEAYKVTRPHVERPSGHAGAAVKCPACGLKYGHDAEIGGPGCRGRQKEEAIMTLKSTYKMSFRPFEGREAVWVYQVYDVPGVQPRLVAIIPLGAEPEAGEPNEPGRMSGLIFLMLVTGLAEVPGGDTKNLDGLTFQLKLKV